MHGHLLSVHVTENVDRFKSNQEGGLLSGYCSKNVGLLFEYRLKNVGLLFRYRSRDAVFLLFKLSNTV
jgi:hypothetical protein